MQKERWHRNGFNLCEVIIVRDGPAPDGQRYLDGRHQVRVALYDRMEDAERACNDHNADI